MKKYTVFTTLFILAALALAACTPSGPIPATGPSGATTGTPVAGSNSGIGAQPTATSPTGMATSTSPAPAATSTQPAATETTAAQPTVAATEAPTTAATATSPSASVNGTPQAGANQAQYVRLSNLMSMTVQTSDNQQAGTVNSVVVERPMVTAGASANSSSVGASAPFIRYVVVDVSPSVSSAAGTGTGNQVFVPWQAFNFKGQSFSLGSPNQSSSASVLTLNVGMTAFTGAQRFDVNQVENSATNDWQSKSSQYWSSQGLSSGTTGSGTVVNQPGDMVIIGKQLDGFNVVGGDNAVLGKVADFLVDTNTGAVAYAVITAQALNGQTFFIPLSHLSWVLPVGKNSLSTLGNLQINITPDILLNAPSFGDLNNLQLSPDWIQKLNQFWQSIQNNPVK